MKNNAIYIIVLFFIIIILLPLSCIGGNKPETGPHTDTETDTEAGETTTESETERIPDQIVYDIRDRKDHPPLDSKEAFVEWRLERIDEKEKFVAWRWDRAEQAILRKDITHQRVLEAFLRTPREVFARKHNESRAYADAALGLAFGQTISGPHMVSRTTNELNPEPFHKVLEIGTGSGYQSAVLPSFPIMSIP